MKIACAAAGARNLSAFTRSELLSSIDTDAQGMTVSERFQVIDEKLGELKNTMIRVVEYLKTKEEASADNPVAEAENA